MPKKLTQKEFIQRCESIYGNRYDYSKVNYVNAVTKVCIICHKKDEYGIEHGEFWVRPSDFLRKISGCRKCHGNYQPKDINEFIDMLHKRHPEYKEKYIIPTDNVYKNNKTKIRVLCIQKDEEGNEHGKFWIRPNDLITGYGCPLCAGKMKKTTEQFIKEAKRVHKGKYDYSLTEYKDIFTKVCIICHERDKYGNEHGKFWQCASNHLNGCGCPNCNIGKKSKKEVELYKILCDKGLKVEKQKTFEWLKYKRNLFLDFYLPDYNIGIEYQGEQHFISVEKFGGYEDFTLRQKRDETKKKLCEEHGLKMFYLRKNINIDDIIDYINETGSTKSIR